MGKTTFTLSILPAQPLYQPLEVFYKKAVHKNFAIFTGKHVLEFLINKIVDLQASNFVNTRLQHRCVFL